MTNGARSPRLLALRVMLALHERLWAKALFGLLLCALGATSVIVGAGHGLLLAVGLLLCSSSVLAMARAAHARRAQRRSKRSHGS